MAGKLKVLWQQAEAWCLALVLPQNISLKAASTFLPRYR
jgi:hypothetical protein